MLRMIRFLLSFLISYAILSIPISGTPLFNQLHERLSPYTSHIYRESSHLISQTIQSGTREAKRFFTNSSPKITEQTDRVDSLLSATKEKANQIRSEVELNLHNEKITQEEKRKLEEVLKQ